MITKQAELSAINAVQSAIDREGLDWVAGETSMSRLTPEEMKRIGVAKVGPPIRGAPVLTRPPHLQGVADPPIFDWRDVDGYNWMTPVRYQGNCGSCWAFGASGVIEAVFNIYSGNPDLNIDISEQHVVSACCFFCGNCNGGWPDWALEYCRDDGIPDEACFPYVANDTPCTPCDDVDDRRYKITGYEYINSTTADFKWALQMYGPMSVVLTTPDDWYFYTAGVYSPTSRAVGWANHAVVLVGWDDTRGAWIIKNSWGEGWGGTGKGYGLVDYGVLEGYNYAYAVTGIVYDGNDKLLPPCGAYGDVNGDGYVTDADADLIGQHVVGSITLTDEQLARADVNNDGDVTSIDDLIIRRYVAGMIDTFPVCEDVANIAAVDITATPSTCESPCDITIFIVWKNVGTVDETFYPGFTVNDTLHGGTTPVMVQAGETWSDSYILHNVTTGSYVICPSPN